MPRSTFVDLWADKNAVTMAQVLERYDLMAQWQQNGDNPTGVRPTQGRDNQTDFSVSISKNCWNCFSRCG